MKLLALDTSTDACSVGLSFNEEVLIDHRIAAQKHGALVLPMVDQLLAEAGISPLQLDGVVYGRGPGSFTGVRIGVAVTQGIALGADVGVLGISTLQSIAQNCYRLHGDTRVAVSMDARMDEIYLAGFQLDESGRMRHVAMEQVCAPSEVPTGSGVDNWRWAGSGAERYTAVEHVRMGCWPNAQDLLDLALPVAQMNGLQSPEHASPVYLRDKVALTTVERDALKASE